MSKVKLRNICPNCLAHTKENPCPYCGSSKKDYEKNPFVLPRGTVLEDKYLIGGCIGTGGFGITYLAYDLRNENVIAVKEYFPSHLVTRDREGNVIPCSEKAAESFNLGAEKFYDEAQLVRRFNGNLNIISIYDCFYQNNTAYFSMEYLDGITLEKYVNKYGVLSSEQALYIGKKIAMALVVLHSGQVIHRDLSPDNIMLCRDGRVKLIDFGAARRFTEEHTLNCTVMAKPGFTPAEQYSKAGKSGAHTDIYSLGTVLYYALTGKIPENPYCRMENDREFSQNTVQADSELWDIIQKAAAIIPKERYQKAEEIKKALDMLKIGEAAIKIPEEYNPLKEKLDSAFNTAPQSLTQNTNLPKSDLSLIVKTAVISVLSTSLIFTGITAFLLNEKNRNSLLEKYNMVYDYSEGNLKMDISTEYKGNEEYFAQIPKEAFEEFNDNVTITMYFDRCAPYENSFYGFKPVDSEKNALTEYLTAAGEVHADSSGGITLYSAEDSFVFSLSREGLKKIKSGGMGIKARNLNITSLLLSKGEHGVKPILDRPYYLPAKALREEGSDTVTACFTGYHKTDWGGNITDYIPKNSLSHFKGNIKATVKFVHDQNSNDNWQCLYFNTIGLWTNASGAGIEIIEETDRSGLILAYTGPNYSLCPDISINEFSFIITPETMERVCDGIFLVTDGMIVKSIKFESAE